MFNKKQAQSWWAENCDKVMELYNVQHCNHEGDPPPAPPRSEDEVSIHIAFSYYNIKSCFYLSDF
ncbi:putative brevis radix (BRX) domain, protein BREVIS RADIX [Helianthus annuus]|nr:putative brevis radix (BRX) domain, protein BREVIS RADIX [Helianthus annuus]